MEEEDMITSMYLAAIVRTLLLQGERRETFGGFYEKDRLDCFHI
jgi:hypothetical protein